MLAGSGLLIIRHVLPRLSSRDMVLGIARMSMNWDVGDVIKQRLRILYFNKPYLIVT